MGKRRTTGKNTIKTPESVTARPEALDFTKSRAVRRQVSVLAKLAGWQKKSAGTDWVIGEYLDAP